MKAPATLPPAAATFSATGALVLATTANHNLIIASVSVNHTLPAQMLFYFFTMKQIALNSHNIFSIPVGNYFGVEAEECQLVYAPLANMFFLSTPAEVTRLEEAAANDDSTNETFKKLSTPTASSTDLREVSEHTFCTLHLLLNEKCNFKCKYCYSASGRSSAQLNKEEIAAMLDYFLSEQRNAVENRTIMFMGGGEPMMSSDLLTWATLYAEKITQHSKVVPHFAVTTNGSILSDDMIAFFKEHNFTVQLSFEVLPDVQNEQRGFYDVVAANVVRLTRAGVNNYVRSTITERNVDRIPEMIQYCHEHFPLVNKLSCQQVVDPSYFTTTEVVNDFFARYHASFKEGERVARQFNITLRSSSSHLLNYSRRERFCYNLVCLTPYGSLTVCPDVSSPQEPDYDAAVFGHVTDMGTVEIDSRRLQTITSGSIHTIEKCRDCYARWNCGSGCPSSRRVYSPEIFDAICNHYRLMLTESLIDALAQRHLDATGRSLFDEVASKLSHK